MADDATTEEVRDVECQLKLFRASLPNQMRLSEIFRLLGRTNAQRCVEIGADTGLVSHHLRKRGGDWHTVVTRPESLPNVQAVVQENVCTWDGVRLPFEDESFDVAIIWDMLERVPDDEAFVADCHRVLKQDGRLVLTATRVKPFSLLNPIRRLVGVDPARLGMTRDGYTEPQLFRVLRDGFDVYEMKHFSRFFVGLTQAIIDSRARHHAAVGNPLPQKLPRFRVVGGFLYRIAYQLDFLLFLSRGFRLVALAKRRAWRAREAPVLVDGRSITEAVLSRAAK